MMARLASAAAILALLAAASPAIAAEPQTSLPDIEDEVMCTICGTTLGLATEAPQAEQERDLIRELIADGLTKDEIKAELVAEYGPEVLATPDDEGFDLAAWIVPLAGLAVALTAIALAVRRWRRATPAPAPPPPESTRATRGAWRRTCGATDPRARAGDASRAAASRSASGSARGSATRRASRPRVRP